MQNHLHTLIRWGLISMLVTGILACNSGRPARVGTGKKRPSYVLAKEMKKAAKKGNKRLDKHLRKQQRKRGLKPAR